MPLGDGRQPGLDLGFSGDAEGLFEWLPLLTKITGRPLTAALDSLAVSLDIPAESRLRDCWAAWLITSTTACYHCSLEI